MNEVRGWIASAPNYRLAVLTERQSARQVALVRATAVSSRARLLRFSPELANFYYNRNWDTKVLGRSLPC